MLNTLRLVLFPSRTKSETNKNPVLKGFVTKVFVSSLLAQVVVGLFLSLELDSLDMKKLKTVHSPQRQNFMQSKTNLIFLTRFVAYKSRIG